MLNKLQEKFEERTPRERMIGMALIALLLWMAWDSFFYQAAQQKQQTLQQELTRLDQQVAEQKLAVLMLEKGPHLDPNLSNQNLLVELQAEHSHLQAQMMAQGDKNFVPPHLMAVALSDILKQNKQLSLLKLETLPAAPLLKSAQTQQNPIYKHGLAISFLGSYLATLTYLTALESLPWHFVWESIDYKVRAFPTAEITIKVYTLSFKETWLGV